MKSNAMDHLNRKRGKDLGSLVKFCVVSTVALAVLLGLSEGSLARPKKPGATTYCSCWCYWKEGNTVHWGTGQYIVDPGIDGLCHNGGTITGCSGRDGVNHVGTLDYCQNKLHVPDYLSSPPAGIAPSEPQETPLSTVRQRRSTIKK